MFLIELLARVSMEDDGSVFTCKAVNEVGEALDAVTMSIACKYLVFVTDQLTNRLYNKLTDL